MVSCVEYIDDIVVKSDTWEDHFQLLWDFLRLQHAQMTINLSKSKFYQARIEFLGHVVGQGEVAPVAAKVAAILKFLAPADKREVIRFLGMACYYRKFCCNFSVVVEPLISLLQKREKFIWSEECQQAFEKVKSLLLSAPVLKALDF